MNSGVLRIVTIGSPTAPGMASGTGTKTISLAIVMIVIGSCTVTVTDVGMMFLGDVADGDWCMDLYCAQYQSWKNLSLFVGTRKVERKCYEHVLS